MSKAISLFAASIAIAIATSTAFAAGCTSKINPKEKPIEPIISCLVELEAENEKLRDEVVKLKATQSTGKPINFGLVDFLFENLVQGAQIPGSEGALFCGLTLVDDDAPSGKCEISRDKDNHWIAKTGGGEAANTCRAMCLMAQ
jgi:hypothetical protein